MRKYLIVEQGEYSDYGVSIIDITNITLTKNEILKLLKIDQYDKPAISGEITGEINFYDNSSISIKDLKEEAESNINGLFSCYRKRKYPTVLDKLYSKEEILTIATTNDSSDDEYWKRKIDKTYEDYVEAFNIYKKLVS